MKKELRNRILTSLILFPLIIYCIYISGFYLTTVLVCIYLISFYEIYKNTKNLLFNLFSNIILIFSLFSFYHLRGETSYSLLTIYWIIISTFLSDIGGYVFGRIFKGKKLTKISPNKTYSGFYGSLILSGASLPTMNLAQEIFLDRLLINFLDIKYFVITILISLVCQLGDLYVSFWKRKIKIKNISNILPGHGGVLDRIDGLLFVLIFCFVLKIINLI
mgnify:FL=1